MTPYEKENYQGEFNLLKMEKELMITAMSKTKGNVTKAAQLLNISRSKLERKLPLHHVKPSYFKKVLYI